MGMLKEFKEFAVKGNLVDIAVAFVMGAAFGKIVTSFIDGIVMPVIGLLTDGVDFSEKKWVLKETMVDGKATEVAIQYGAFITNLIDFIVVAFCMFLVIKAINRMKRAEHEVVTAPEPSATDKLLMEIRDELKKN